MQPVKIHLQRAMAAFSSKKYRETNQICLQILKNTPNQLDALHLLAITAKHQNDWKQSQQYFEKCLSINANQPVVLTNYANLLVSIGNISQAESYYRKSLLLAPQNIDAIFNLASLLNNKNKPKDALDLLDRAIIINPNNPSYFNLRGNCFKKLKEHSKAITEFDVALKLNPNDFYALHSKGITFREIQQPQKAIDCYLRIYQQGKTIPEFLFNLGCAYYDLEEYDKTEKYLKMAIALKPDYINAHEALNKYYWEHSKQEDFLQSYQAAIAANEKSAGLHYSYASYLIKANREEQAQEELQKAIKTSGGRPEFTHALAVLIAKKGDLEQSIPLIDEAIRKQPENTRYRIDMANLLIRQSNYHGALKHLEKASRFAPINQEIWAYKGICWRLLADERALWLNNYNTFVQARMIETPEGYDNLEHFFHELSSVLENMHTSVNQPLDQSVRGGTQTVKHLLLEPAKVIQDYAIVLNKRIQAYINGLPNDPSHPFLMRKSANYNIAGCWSVRLNSDGFHTNHVHPVGWLSGPTYINVPSNISIDDPTKSGWVKFGETSLELGEREKMGLEICPQPGLCVLFPSYIWHGTHTFQSHEYRMTASCDIMPG